VLKMSNSPDLGSFIFGAIVGFGVAWLMYTETGQMLLGVSKEKIKAKLRERLERL